ncbi:hypothetical protein [Okeania sp.]|uniref:hypothetical protein n=1 Tax=Okeania sp. TaxID=3100323 RepID=UPI002B4B3DB2|nr:hypothetical protein [Okeania sp.]MEB3341452.1 hypothetical protein [Okeania sp.]
MVEHIATTEINFNLIHDYINFLHFLEIKILYNWPTFAQQVDVDLWADVQKAWNKFIECGQGTALLVGLIIGWMVKSILP